MRFVLLIACMVLVAFASTSTAGSSAAPAESMPVPTGASVAIDCFGVGVGVTLALSGGAPRVALSHGDPHFSAPLVLPSPSGTRSYVPVAVACTPSREGAPYVTVLYAEPQRGCSVCEWLYAYDAGGHLLNQGAALFLYDAGLPAPQQRYPDNSAYTAVAERLHLASPRFKYLPEETPFDALPAARPVIVGQNPIDSTVERRRP